MRSSELSRMIPGRGKCNTIVLFTPISPFRLSDHNSVRNFRVPHT